MRESKIEKKVFEYAEELGWFQCKFKTPSRRGVPDRIFMRDGKTFFIEFKAPDKPLRLQQRKTIKKFEFFGFNCFVVDDINKGIKLLNDIEERKISFYLY